MNEAEHENELIDGMTVEQIRDRLQTPNRCWSDSYCDCAQQHAADRLLEHYDALAARLAEAEALLRTEQQWLRETFGERCSDYEPDCCGCQAWKQIDRIDAFLAPDIATPRENEAHG